MRENQGCPNDRIIHIQTKKYPQFSCEVIRKKVVDNVENY